MPSCAQLAAAGAAVALMLAAGFAAEAKCTRLAFSVNDYGKDGPTKDARELLDKYIAKWTAEQGIKTYTVGKKDVTCELFLNFIVFDEHTCKAEASVCWPDGDAGRGKAATPPVAPAKPSPAPAAKKSAAASVQ